MRRLICSPLAILGLIQFMLVFVLTPQSLAQEWKFRVKPKGTLKVVDLFHPSYSAMWHYSQALVNLDKDSNQIPGLAEDWRWIDDRTIEFKLRQGVTFHNGEKFNAEAVKINWEEYKRLEYPTYARFLIIPDETIFEIIDEYTVRFTFPQPDGLALVKFEMFAQYAPKFFARHKFDEGNWGSLPEPGPWGAGAFKLVEGGVSYAGSTDRVVLEAYDGYWDRQYPKVQRVIFDNTLIGNRKEAMRLCRETEGQVDIVSHIRPLDTLKVAESKFAKVVKSKDFTWFGGALNQRKKESKWRDIRLRRALNYAVNREELWKYAAKGNACNLGGGIPPGAPGHNPDLAPWTYDTPKARALLAEAGYPNGFEVNMITTEAWQLEAQIISKMLERIGLKVRLDVLTRPEHVRKMYIPVLGKPPEESKWDIVIGETNDYFGHAVSFLTYIMIEDSDWRWIEYDPVYEEMWKKMARTVDPEAQEEKIQHMTKYQYDHAIYMSVYSPLTLYAVNKEVNFVPQKYTHLIIRETSVTDSHWSMREENQ